jgi:uncharacterized membrane protein YsdA (DUF1294 family)
VPTTIAVILPLLFKGYSLFDNVVLIWVIILGIFAFILMGYDKLAAKVSPKRRVRERNLWLVSAMGGFVGVCLGAVVFHHKVSKGGFWPPVIASLIVWLIAFYFLKIV